MSDGVVTIKTKIDNKDLNKDLVKTEKELEKFSKQEEKLLEQKQKLEIDTSKSYNDLQNIDDKLEIINQKIKNMEEANLPQNLATNVDYQKLLNQSDQLNRKGEEYLQKLEMQKVKMTDINSKLVKNRKAQAKLNEELTKMHNKIDLSNIELNKVGKGLTKVIKKVAKWALAVLGVRTAYNAIRSAMSTLSQYETSMVENINYIKYALAYTLKPLIEWLINALAKILQYVNYIYKAWTGKNLFKTADAFKKAQNNAKALNKELSKTIASFDEMNVLQDTSSGSASTTTSVPTFDLTSMEGEIPDWLQFIVDNKEDILATIAGITAGLLAWNFGLSGLKALGIGIALTYIYKVIQDIKALLEDPTWEKVNKLFIDIGGAVLGIGIAIGSLPAIIVGAGMIIIGTVTKYWGEITEIFNLGVSKITGLFKFLFGDFFGSILATGFLAPFQMAFEKATGFIGAIKYAFKALSAFLGGDWKKGLEYTFKAIGNYFIGVINALIVGINAVLAPMRALIVAYGKVTGKKWTFDDIKIPKIPYLARGGIVNNPSHGVMVGGAIAGEAGKEAVLPITDPAIMAMIGESIGKYVNINATVPVYVGNRQIAREIKKINANNDFAFNR